MKMYRLAILFLSFCCLPFTVQAQQKDSLQNLVNRRQYAEAIVWADSLTALDSTDYVTMYTAGQAYDGLLRYRVAYDYYYHCYLMDTTNVDILNTLARTAINLGKAADAEYFFQKVLASDSLNFYTNYQLARLYYQLGDYEKAISIYQRLIEVNEQNPALLTALGDCYTKLGVTSNAFFSYFFAYNYNRENAGLASALINTMLRLGGNYIADALAICDTALYYNPGNRQLLRDKGQYHISPTHLQYNCRCVGDM